MESSEELKVLIQNIFVEEEKKEEGDPNFGILLQKIRQFVTARIARTDSIPVQIIPGLYIGSIGAAMSKDQLDSNKISHILVAANGIKPIHENFYQYKVVSLVDLPSEDIKKHFKECSQFIEKALCEGGRVLVHCFAGKSRSASVIIAYLMEKCSMNFENALTFVRMKRPEAEPNEGFVKQLKQYGEELVKEQMEKKQEQLLKDII